MKSSKIIHQVKKTEKKIDEWMSAHIQELDHYQGYGYEYISDSKHRYSMDEEYVDTIMHLHESIGKQIKRLCDRIATRQKLKKAHRGQPLFDQIEEMFLIQIKYFYTMLNMSQFDRMDGDKPYAEKTMQMLSELVNRMRKLMQHYGNYITALTQMEFTDTSATRVGIEEAVNELCKYTENIL